MKESESFDFDAVEKSLQSVNRKEKPLHWAELMNIKGVLLRDRGLYDESGKVFREALPYADDTLKCKMFINNAKSHFFAGRNDVALRVAEEVFKLCKDNRRLSNSVFMAYTHLLRGQIFYSKGDEKTALNEFKRAEFYFENCIDSRGVGLSCLEIARIHIKTKNLTTAWNFLRKGESFLRMLGAEEKLGVAVCKGVALYFAGKHEEALAVMEGVYDEREEFGQGRYTMEEVLDVYLDTRSRLRQYQSALM